MLHVRDRITYLTTNCIGWCHIYSSIHCFIHLFQAISNKQREWRQPRLTEMWEVNNVGRRGEDAWDCLVAWENSPRKNIRGEIRMVVKELCTWTCQHTHVQLAATVDLLPTIAKFTEAPLPPVVLDGFDMSPILFYNMTVSATDALLLVFAMEPLHSGHCV